MLLSLLTLGTNISHSVHSYVWLAHGEAQFPIKRPAAGTQPLPCGNHATAVQSITVWLKKQPFAGIPRCCDVCAVVSRQAGTAEHGNIGAQGARVRDAAAPGGVCRAPKPAFSSCFRGVAFVGGAGPAGHVVARGF